MRKTTFHKNSVDSERLTDQQYILELENAIGAKDVRIEQFVNAMDRVSLQDHVHVSDIMAVYAQHKEFLTR